MTVLVRTDSWYSGILRSPSSPASLPAALAGGKLPRLGISCDVGGRLVSHVHHNSRSSRACFSVPGDLSVDFRPVVVHLSAGKHATHYIVLHSQVTRPCGTNHPHKPRP